MTLESEVVCPLDPRMRCNCIYQTRLRKAASRVKWEYPHLNPTQVHNIAAGRVIEQVGPLPACPVKARRKAS